MSKVIPFKNTKNKPKRPRLYERNPKAWYLILTILAVLAAYGLYAMLAAYCCCHASDSICKDSGFDDWVETSYTNRTADMCESDVQLMLYLLNKEYGWEELKMPTDAVNYAVSFTPSKTADEEDFMDFLSGAVNEGRSVIKGTFKEQGYEAYSVEITRLDSGRYKVDVKALFHF